MTKKISSIFSIAILVAVSFSSCGTATGEYMEAQPVRFTSAVSQGVSVDSRATGSDTHTWSAAGIGIFMQGAGNVTLAGNRQHVTTTGGATFAPAQGHRIFWPVNDDEVSFIAYYPYASHRWDAHSGGMDFPVQIEALQNEQQQSNLLWAKATGKNRNSGTVPLEFDHMLTKIVFNTQPGEGLTNADLLNMTVTVKGMYRNGLFEWTTGGFIPGRFTDRGDIGTHRVTPGERFEAIVLPLHLAAGALTFEFHLNNAANEVFTWTNSGGEELFEPGRMIVYTTTIRRVGVSFEATVNDWVVVNRPPIVAE